MVSLGERHRGPFFSDSASGTALWPTGSWRGPCSQLTACALTLSPSLTSLHRQQGRPRQPPQGSSPSAPPRLAGGAHLAPGPPRRNGVFVCHVPCPRRTHRHQGRRPQPRIWLCSHTRGEMCGNPPGLVGGPTRVPACAEEQHYAGMAVSDHQGALCLGHPAGLDHTTVATRAGQPREFRQKAAPWPPAMEGKQKGARVAGHHPERRGTSAVPPHTQSSRRYQHTPGSLLCRLEPRRRDGLSRRGMPWDTPCQ